MMSSDGLLLGLYLKESDRGTDMYGIFTRERLTGMLEAVDIRRIDRISLFLGVLMDSVSDQTESSPVKTMLKDYVDIMADVCGIKKSGK